MLYAKQNINTRRYICVFNPHSLNAFAATTPAIIRTGRQTQGSTLNRPRRAWKWKRKAAAPRKMERRRGTGRRKERRRKPTKTAHYQRRRSQRRRGRFVIGVGLWQNSFFPPCGFRVDFTVTVITHQPFAVQWVFRLNCLKDISFHIQHSRNVSSCFL